MLLDEVSNEFWNFLYSFLKTNIIFLLVYIFSATYVKFVVFEQKLTIKILRNSKVCNTALFSVPNKGIFAIHTNTI